MAKYCYKLFCFALFFILTSKLFAVASDIPSEEIKQAAKQGLVNILKDRRNGNFDKLGFRNQIEIDSADISDGFQVYTINPEKLLNDHIEQDLQSFVTPTGQWQFTVRVGVKAYALLTVDIVDEKWTPVSIGASGIAKEMSNIFETWPASSGYEYRVIRVYQASSNFVEISKRGKILGIIPLSSFLMATADKAHSFDPHDLRDPKEVITKLVPVVKRNTKKIR
jgi:hypothetical protein